MYPVAHAWLASRLLGPTPSDAALLGCVWPDMLFGSPITHEQAHHAGAGLLSYARDLPTGAEREEFLDFARGVLTHGAEPHGFDWFSDESWGGQLLAAKGFAFQRGLPLASATARACGLPEALGPWKAHNVIEMAFERPLLLAAPDVAARLQVACGDDALIERIARPIADFFGTPAGAVTTSMRAFRSAVSLFPASLRSLAEMYAVQTRLKHPDARPDASVLGALIGAAEALIAPERDVYLAVCLASVRETLAALDALP